MAVAEFLDRFERSVREREHLPAYLLDEEHISLGEANALANRFARWLIDTLGDDSAVVGICTDARLETGAYIFGILKAGKVFLGLDPAYPAERIRYMVEQSGCSLIVTDGAVSPDVFGDVRMVSVRNIASMVRPYPGSNLRRGTEGEQPAYVTFTSGSTGRPKAVLAPVRQVDNRFSWMWENYPFGVGEVCCHRMPLSFVDTV